MSEFEIPPVVGMIAGNGLYPGTFARAARKSGVGKIVAAAFVNETDPALSDLVDQIEWMRVGQLGKMIRHFKTHGVNRAVMVGQIAPRNLFDLRPDLRTLKMLSRVKERNAESLFSAIASEMEVDGITLMPATTFLEDLLPGPGHVCGPALSERQEEDAIFGFRIAKEISRLDIGQTVVVKKGLLDTINEDFLKKHCSENLALFKIPQFWELKDDLTISPTGKKIKKI